MNWIKTTARGVWINPRHITSIQPTETGSWILVDEGVVGQGYADNRSPDELMVEIKGGEGGRERQDFVRVTFTKKQAEEQPDCTPFTGKDYE